MEEDLTKVDVDCHPFHLWRVLGLYGFNTLDTNDSTALSLSSLSKIIANKSGIKLSVLNVMCGNY